MPGPTNMPDLKTRLTLDIGDFTRGLVDARAQAGLFSREISNVSNNFKTAGVAMATFATVSLFTAGIVATAFMSAIGVLMTLGAVSAFQADSVKVAWAQTGEHIRQGMLQASRAYIPVLERLAGKASALFDHVQPALTQVFDTLGPLFEDLSTEFMDWFGGIVNSLPGMVNHAIAFLFSIGPAWDSMTDNMRAGWNQVYESVISFGPTLLQNGLPPFGQFVGNVLALLAPIIQAASEFAGPFLSSMALIAGVAGPLLGSILGSITGGLIELSGVLGTMGVGLAVMLGGIGGPLAGLIDDLSDLGTTIAATFVGLAPTLQGLLQNAADFGHEIQPVLAAVGAWLVEFGPVAVAIGHLLVAMTRGFVTGIQPILDAMGVDWSSGLVAGIYAITPAMENLALYTGEFVTAIVTGASYVISAISNIVSVVTGLTANFGAVGQDAGRAIVIGLIAGVGFMISPLVGVMALVAATVGSFLPRSPAEVGPLSGDGSPDQRGYKVGAMFADGIASSTGLVQAAALKLATSVQMPSQPNAIGTSSMPSSLGGLLNGAVGAATNVVVNVAGSVTAESDLLTTIKEAMLQRESRNAGSVFATAVR